MNTKIYHRENATTGIIEWFWRERLAGGFGPESEAFDTRREAAEAAKKARRIARGDRCK